MNTDPALLRTFVAVAETASFGRAAEQLHLDASTVSRQVAQLERRLGLRLFDRTTRQVWLSDSGRALLADARAVLAALDDFGRAAEAIDRQCRGEVVLGFQAHAINTEVLGWIADAEARCNGASVRLAEGNFGDPSTGLHDRSSDLAIVFCPFDSAGIEMVELFELPWLMFLPADHRCATRPTVHLHELFDEPWIRAATSDEIFTDYWLANDLRDGRPVVGTAAHATPEASLALIATGRGIGAGASVRAPLQLDGVVVVPVADNRRTTVALAWRTGGLTPSATRLRDALVEGASTLRSQALTRS